MIDIKDLIVRDPFIVPWQGEYYMTGSAGGAIGEDVKMYCSVDLKNWEDLGVIYKTTQASWVSRDAWACEIHRYKGKFYAFVSSLGKNGLRGTQIAVCDTIDGKYVPLTDRPVTPIDKSCIDCTFFEQNGMPYIVYSRDWPDNYSAEKDCYIGQIWAAALEADLSQIKDEPFLLFNSNDAPLSAKAPNKQVWLGKDVWRYGSDGPFVHKLENGSLLLLWSPVLGRNYVVLGAISKNGDIHGPWEHIDKPLYDKNGGHAMIFTDFYKQKIMSLHTEKMMEERAVFVDITEKLKNCI